MVQKLRRKFVITATLSLLAILIVMIAVINISNVSGVFRDADNLLAILTTNDGHFPGIFDNNADFQQSSEDKSSDRKNFSQPQVPIDKMFDHNNTFTFAMLNNTKSAEMPYQSRYFVVWFDSSQNISDIDLMHIAAISESDAASYGRSEEHTSELQSR